MEATSTFSVALILSGVVIVMGSLLYVVIILMERAKLNKLINEAMANEQAAGKVPYVV